MNDSDFLELCKKGSLRQISEAIKNGANVNAKNSDGITALMRAAGKNPDPEVTAALIDAGAEVNVIASIDDGSITMTPLKMAAAYNPNPEVAEALLKAGADPNERDADRMTPLMSAAYSNPNPEVITALVNAGAKVNARDTNGRLVLMNAAASEYSSPEVMAALIKAGADPNAKDDNGVSVLTCAVTSKRPEIISVVIDAIANSGAKLGADVKNQIEMLDTAIKDGSMEEALKTYFDDFNEPRDGSDLSAAPKAEPPFKIAPDIEPFYKRAVLFLSNGDFNRAREYFGRILDIDPELAPAHVLKLCAELKVKNEAELINQDKPLDNMPDYQRAMSFAADDYRLKLEGYNRTIKRRLAERQEKARKTRTILIYGGGAAAAVALVLAAGFGVWNYFSGGTEQTPYQESIAASDSPGAPAVRQETTGASSNAAPPRVYDAPPVMEDNVYGQSDDSDWNLPANTPGAVTDTGQRQIATIRGNSVRIRSEPNTADDYNIVHQVNNGDSVAVIDTRQVGPNEFWYFVEYQPGRQGWVRSDLLTLQEAGSTPPLLNTGANAVIKGDSVRIRSAPSTANNNNIVHQANNGERVAVIGRRQVNQNEVWYFVEYQPGRQGWVRSDLLTVF